MAAERVRREACLMVNLVVIGEGQSEETFVRTVLAPALGFNGVYATARLIPTSKNQRGGALNLERVRNFIRNTLKERNDTYVTTFFDLYGLDQSFRGVAESRGRSPAERATHVEVLLHEDIMSGVPARPERFFAHVQPHEFETLLFSDVNQLCTGELEWHVQRADLAAVRRGVENPEWINDSPETAPSKHLGRLRPRYRKVSHGPVAAARIGLDKIREQCPHFRQWYDWIVALPVI
jgi:hypothetical protein